MEIKLRKKEVVVLLIFLAQRLLLAYYNLECSLKHGITGCSTGSIPDGRRIFGQYMGSVPIQHREEFGNLLMCSGTLGLESQQRLRDSTCRPHHPKTGRVIFPLCLRASKNEASRLAALGSQWAVKPRDYFVTH